MRIFRVILPPPLPLRAVACAIVPKKITSQGRIMRIHAYARLPGIFVAGILLLMPGLAFATVYKCVENNRVTYSSETCTKQAQGVQTQIQVSVMPAIPHESGSGKSSGGMLDKLGLGGTDMVTILLFSLIPLSIVMMFVFSRKSSSAK
jgi:hypothetical protein